MADTSKTNTNSILEAAQKAGEQLVSAVKQNQSIALDVARAFAEAVPPVPARLSKAPAVVAWSDVPAATAYSFDLAAELLEAQKDFAVRLASTFAPAKTA